VFVQVVAHANSLRTLTRKKGGDLHGPVIPEILWIHGAKHT
jgi:hypothetical protein